MAEGGQDIAGADERLVRAALHGDVAAFGRLVQRYWKVAFALALSRVNDTAEAEDVAQESFLKAYSQLHSLRDPRRFAGWLSKIVLQQCTNTIRRNIRGRAALANESAPLSDLDSVSAYSANPGLTEPQIQFVRRTVGQLPQKLRTLVILRFTAGLSAVQIAEQLGQRPGTVRVWLHRAYTILRKDLAGLLEEVES